MRRVGRALGLLAAPAFAAAAYDKTDTYAVRQRVPWAAMAIAPLKTELFARWKKDSGEIKNEAKQEKSEVPQYFHAYALDTGWRVTFESARLISLSGNSFIDENGAHPNPAFDSVVWVKTVTKEAGSDEPPDPSMADEGISQDGQKLGHYALTYAKGDSKANGIVLLYGAGEAWAHVMGDFRLGVPVSVFRKYLSPEWAAEFK